MGIDAGVLAGELRDTLLQGAKRELQVRGEEGGHRRGSAGWRAARCTAVGGQAGVADVGGGGRGMASTRAFWLASGIYRWRVGAGSFRQQAA